MSINLEHLAIFHAVADEKSVSRGAERLLVSQPAVSKQLRSFERSLGLILFERTSRGVRLTEAGELLHRYAERVFAIEKEASQALEQLKGLARGRLAVGASTTIGTYLLPEVFVEFRRKYPGIDASLAVSSSDAIAERIADGSLDLGFIESKTDKKSCRVETFMKDELVAIIKPGHPLLKKRRISAGDFCCEPFIVRATGSDTRSFVERELLSRGLAVQPVMSLASTEAIKRAVAAGIGVGIVSRMSIAMELKLKTLAIARIADFSIHRTLYCVLRDGAPSSRAADQFRALIQHCVKRSS